MQVWQKLMALAGSGALLGTLAGIALDPTMKPAPDSPWGFGSAQPDGIYRIVDAGPSDLSAPNWYDTPVDVEVPRYAPYVPVHVELDPLPLPDPEPEDGAPSPGEPMEPPALAGADDPHVVFVAMDAESAAADAQAMEAAAAPVSIPDAQPALVEDSAQL